MELVHVLAHAQIIASGVKGLSQQNIRNNNAVTLAQVFISVRIIRIFLFIFVRNAARDYAHLFLAIKHKKNYIYKSSCNIVHCCVLREDKQSNSSDLKGRDLITCLVKYNRIKLSRLFYRISW